MRKPYQKPMLYVERFELSEHIAIGCKLINTGEKTLTDPNNCQFNHGGVLIFAISEVCSSNGGIVMDPENNVITCYHGPSPDKVVFSS